MFRMVEKTAPTLRELANSQNGTAGHRPVTTQPAVRPDPEAMRQFLREIRNPDFENPTAFDMFIYNVFQEAELPQAEQDEADVMQPIEEVHEEISSFFQNARYGLNALALLVISLGCSHDRPSTVAGGVMMLLVFNLWKIITMAGEYCQSDNEESDNEEGEDLGQQQQHAPRFA